VAAGPRKTITGRRIPQYSITPAMGRWKKYRIVTSAMVARTIKAMMMSPIIPPIRVRPMIRALSFAPIVILRREVRRKPIKKRPAVKAKREFLFSLTKKRDFYIGY